jgi:hypothetical protein
MSSGKLKLNTIVRSNKICSVIFYSDLFNPSIASEITSGSGLEHFSRIRNEGYEFYHKAFEIHLFLLRNENLSNREKLELCKIERNYIKLYLKAIMKKNYV